MNSELFQQGGRIVDWSQAGYGGTQRASVWIVACCMHLHDKNLCLMLMA
jgi:hypothetical protein